MNQTALATLHSVLETTLEDFAFMFVEPVDRDQDLGVQDEEQVWARIVFTGPEGTGSLVALASFGFCRRLSQNILGLETEDELPPGTAESALCELINVTCGSLAEALYGEEAPVDLKPPEYELCSSRAWSRFMTSEHSLVVLVDEDPVGFELQSGVHADD